MFSFVKNPTRAGDIGRELNTHQSILPFLDLIYKRIKCYQCFKDKDFEAAFPSNLNLEWDYSQKCTFFLVFFSSEELFLSSNSN